MRGRISGLSSYLKYKYKIPLLPFFLSFQAHTQCNWYWNSVKLKKRLETGFEITVIGLFYFLCYFRKAFFSKITLHWFSILRMVLCSGVDLEVISTSFCIFHFNFTWFLRSGYKLWLYYCLWQQKRQII